MLEKVREPTKPIADNLAKRLKWLSPNAITIIGFLLTAIPVFFFCNGKPRLGGIGILVTFLDFLDGAVARYSKKVSLFGEVLDASLDRIVDALIIFSIAQGGFISWSLAFLVLIGFYMVSYIRARTGEATAKKVKLDVGIAQRGERLILIMLASVLYIDKITLPVLELELNSLKIIFGVLMFLTWQTAIWRFIMAYKKIKRLNSDN